MKQRYPQTRFRIECAGYEIEIRGELAEAEAALEAVRLAEGLYVVHFRISAAAPTCFAPLRLGWAHPSRDIQATWNPSAGFFRGLRVDWGSGFVSKATSNAPVVALHNLMGRNRLTFAFSDALNPVEMRAGIHEETGEFHCTVDLFSGHHPPAREYTGQLLLDIRDTPYYEALRNVSDWWAGMPGNTPAPVPDTARLPMLSTWYSFHQHLESTAIEEQCRLAKRLGCEAVIVDDGWQTNDGNRGYAHCGDWEPERLADIKAHVARVHAIGMKYLLWFSVPFVGFHSKVYGRFKGRALFSAEGKETIILDPRHPEAREYLLEKYELAVREWDVDGLKLDFVDAFNPGPDCIHAAGDGRDYASIDAAVDRLLADAADRLRKLKPDIMIEFRQSYTGPVMRRYGNIFRVGDCPNDGLRNRIGILDIRLLCGITAAHGDMLMWHPEDPVESAALQILNSLFGVPQISVMLDKLPAAHLEMLGFWLAFWRAHRDVLLDGDLRPLHPETFFPVVIASTAATRIVAVYDEAVANPGAGAPPELLVINATRASRVVLELEEALRGSGEFLDCRGRTVMQTEFDLAPGVHSLAVPPAGMFRLRRTA